ncbi:MAG: dynamin family protein [Planctomycetota bacterium]|nr:dynamin family protein [Planctomycetota bacterium]
MNEDRSRAARGELGRLHEELAGDLEAIAPLRAVAGRAADLAELVADLSDQLGRASSAAVVCLVGSTGAGKSTLLNALVGRDIAVEGIDRPTTSAPVIYRPADADITELLAGLPGEAPRVVTYDHRDGGGVETFWRGQILIDAPDTNSVETTHREVVRELAARSDVLVVVAHRQSVAELSSAAFVDLFAGRRGMVFVLGRGDELDAAADADLRAQLEVLARERWLAPGAPVLTVSARRGKEDPVAGGLPVLRKALADMISEERLGSVRRQNAVGNVARIAAEVGEARQDIDAAASRLRTGLESGAATWCGRTIGLVHERLDERRADLTRMLWNDAAKVWDGPGGYALRVGGLGALGLGAGAAVARRNPMLAAGLAVGGLAASRVQGAVRDRAFESTSGLLPGGTELGELQREAFLEARLAAADLAVDDAAPSLAPGGADLASSAAAAVDEAWDRLLRVDLPREARRGVPRLLRLLVDLPVLGLGAWVLFRTLEGFIAEEYVGVDFLVSAIIIAFAWLFGARVLVRARFSGRSASLLAKVRGDIEQRVGAAAGRAIAGPAERLQGLLGSADRVELADRAWRRRLHGEE